MDMQTYRDGRKAADNASKALREALRMLGLPPTAYDHVRPTVTHKGTAYVHIGMLRAEYIEQIAEALRAPAREGRQRA